MLRGLPLRRTGSDAPPTSAFIPLAAGGSLLDSRESDHRRGYRGLAGTNHSNDKPPRLLSPPGRSATYESYGDVGGVRIRLRDAGAGRVQSPISMCDRPPGADASRETQTR
jgi:hypothetical protein